VALAEQLTGFYKEVRTTVQHGKLYRLQRPEGNEAAQVEYAAQDGSQVVLFSYLHSQSFGMAQPRVHLQGLDANAMYSVRPLDAAKYTGGKVVSGAELMGDGVAVHLQGDYDSTALLFQREPASKQ
jgi:alpha-galactosidase